MAELTGNAKLNSRKKELDDLFDLFKPVYQDVSNYILPARGQYLEGRRDPDVNDIIGRFNNILDPTATRAASIAAAMMQGGLADSTTRWFGVGLMDKSLERFGPVKSYLSAVENLMYDVFDNSNFYQVVQTCIEEESGFGTASVLAEEHDQFIVNYRLTTAGQYRIANGSDGFVDTTVRTPKMSAREMVQKFTFDRCSDQVQKASKLTPYQYFDTVQFIMPNEDFVEGSPFPKDFAYKNIWYEPTEDSKRLLDSGYHEKPFAAPRWSVVGDIPNGFGPGMLALGKVKMLQEFEKGSVKGLHKTNDPPMAINSKYKGVLSLLPGASNFMPGDDMGKAAAPLFRIDIRWKDLEFKIESMQKFIEKIFYNDLFFLITQTTKQITIPELLERQGEKLLVLGPVVRRQITELFNPMMERTFNIIQRRDNFLKSLGFGGLLPDPPAELENAQIKIHYDSALAQAAQALASRSINSQMSMVERVAGLDPQSAMASTDFITMLSMHADAINAPVEITRSPEDARAILDAFRLADQKAAEQQQLLEATTGAKNLGQAKVGEGTALDALAEGV